MGTMLGRRVKKLVWQNKYTLDEIAKICNSTIEECSTAYEDFMGHKLPATFLLAGSEEQQNQLRTLILQNKKILLFGTNGVGKSSLPRLIAKEVGWRIRYSHPRSSDDLLKDFGELPLKTKKTIFVIEGDSFYWRSYALVNHYIKESKNPIIIIVDDKDKVHATVSKQLIIMKLLPPTKRDVEVFIKKKFPNFKGNIDEIYDKDMRITLRNIIYSINSYIPQEKIDYDAQKIAYSILNKRCTIDQLNSCKDPIFFITNWLGNNAHKFYNDLDNIDKISFVDAYKFIFKRKYLDGVLLSLDRFHIRGKMSFPPTKFKPKKEKDDDWEHGKKKVGRSRKKEESKGKVLKQTLLVKFTGDMEL